MTSKEAQLRNENSKAWVAQQHFRIAIDGPAGAGKSTVAQLVAAQLNYLYIDTGAMYRAATLLALREKLDLADQKVIANRLRQASIELSAPDENSNGKIRVFLNSADVSAEIRGATVTSAVSAVSAMPAVREILVEKQRVLAKGGRAILDGRDIGTVVLPDADMKFFLTASAGVRARRRYDELCAAGHAVVYETILSEIIQRDSTDSNRDIAPLRQSPDAVLIITDNMTIAEVVETIINLCDRRH